MRNRSYAAIMSLVLAAGMVVAVQRTAAGAATGGPSVPLPETPSVPVTRPAVAPVPPDATSSRALRGDQPAGTAPKDGGGTPVATSLAPSATWNVSAQTGDFHWSYPLRVPPAPGGLAPKLALSYASSAVDGRTSATNNQASWVGDGWALSPGFVERTYAVCQDDKEGGTAPATGDLCWRSDNATASYNGGGGMLVRDDATGAWRPRNDDGSRVERFTGAGTGDNDGESWRVTTVDGTQYHFGSRPEAASTWTVPVFGDDAGEPCHGGSFASSRCPQAWRWNLDKVVDPHGNTILYFYDAESNAYGANLQDPAVPYVRGGTLRRIEYGLHAAVPGPAAARVEFGTADRCVPGSVCALDRTENWPDTPLAERCATATCHDHWSPTFWSTKRLSTVTTQVWRGSAYSDVDRWTLDHQFPDPGDGEKAALWLKSIIHTGLVGGSLALPEVTFQGVALANRVQQGENLSPVVRYRITGIISETGGAISVNYTAPNCVPGSSMPAGPESNTLRCFPVKWQRPGFGERTDWFHKYVVESIVSSDRMGVASAQTTAYEYLDGAAWHLDTSEFTPADRRTYNEFRGFSRIRVRNGQPADPGGPVTMTEQLFYRGMGGSVSDSEGGTRADEDWLQGFPLETTTYLGETAEVVTRTVSDPVWQGPTAARGTFKAYIVRVGVERTHTTMDGGRPRRVTREETTYDNRGLPVTVNDLGDVATSTDDLCTRTTYVRNTTAWLLSLPARRHTVGVHCGATTTTALADDRVWYDGQEYGFAPTSGKSTRTEALNPAPGATYATVSTVAYDVHGRVVQTKDALGHAISVEYTPAQGGPTTKTMSTDALGFSTTTVIEPASGQPLVVTDPNGRVAESAYDALGRVARVWLPDRRRTTYPTSPSATYAYQVRRDEPSAVTTSTLGANENYVTSTVLYDGLLRTRQVQAPAAGGGRLLTDIRYDTQGRTYKATQPFYNSSTVDDRLWAAHDDEIPGMTTTGFDGAGRPVRSIFLDRGQEKWRTTLRYGGDRVTVEPPAGGIPTTTVTDARGRTTDRYQRNDRTRYTYTPLGLLGSVQDPAGNRWQFAYDVRGQQTRADDPDKGTTLSTYDTVGRVVTTTDARGRLITHTYDDLNRPTGLTTAGRPLARWTYDTVPYGKGMPATATAYDTAGNAYTTAVELYTARYRPLRQSITIPPSEGLLAGTYTTRTSYRPDGNIRSKTYPAGGGLPEEEVFHTYDDSGRPLTTYGSSPYVTDTVHTRYGEPQRVQLGAEPRRIWQSTYYEDATRRVQRSIVDAEVPNPMQTDVRHTYDPAGNITSIVDAFAGDSQCFRYDPMRRLTEAWTPASGCAADPMVGSLSGPAPYWQSYRYDITGNRISDVRHAAGGDTTRTYSFPAAGTVRPHAPTGNSYDAAGNTTTRGGQQLTWDDLGHLASVAEAGRTTTYAYGPSGERLLRREPGATTLYLSGQELRLDTATGVVAGTRYYAHGGNVIASRTAAGGVAWLASDHHGTAHVAVNSASQTTAVRRTDPFGNPRGSPPASWPNERGFVGGTIDAGTGLTHLGAREYDPPTGRFLSVDPILDLTDPQQFNAYAYANNNPTTMSDPDGLKVMEGDTGWTDSGPSRGGGRAANPATTRATQHDWDGADGRRGHVGQYNPLDRPVRPGGKPVSQETIDNLRTYHDYKGSNAFTYGDLLDFARQGPDQFTQACYALGGTADKCVYKPSKEPEVQVLTALIPLPDVSGCADDPGSSCADVAAGFFPLTRLLSRFMRIPGFAIISSTRDRANIAVVAGDRVVHTEMGANAIAVYTGSRYWPNAMRFEVDLRNAPAAQKFQHWSAQSGQRFPSNDPIAYCCNVLKAGGIKRIPEDPDAALMWLIENTRMS